MTLKRSVRPWKSIPSGLIELTNGSTNLWLYKEKRWTGAQGQSARTCNWWELSDRSQPNQRSSGCNRPNGRSDEWKWCCKRSINRPRSSTSVETNEGLADKEFIKDPTISKVCKHVPILGFIQSRWGEEESQDPNPVIDCLLQNQ